MSTQRLSKDAIFNAAAELSDTDQRKASLMERARILLKCERKSSTSSSGTSSRGVFLKPRAGLLGTTLWRSITDKRGNQIGCYKLLQEFGEGGFRLSITPKEAVRETAMSRAQHRRFVEQLRLRASSSETSSQTDGVSRLQRPAEVARDAKDGSDKL